MALLGAINALVTIAFRQGGRLLGADTWECVRKRALAMRAILGRQIPLSEILDLEDEALAEICRPKDGYFLDRRTARANCQGRGKPRWPTYSIEGCRRSHASD